MGNYCCLLIAVVLASACFASEAAILNLTEDEANQMARLIREDAGARQLAQEVIAQAKSALKHDPSPLKTIHYEGLLDTHPDRTKTVAALVDMDRMIPLALAHRLTGDAAFRGKAVEIINAWATVYQPTGNPINENKLDPLVVAYSHFRSSIPESQRTAIDIWLRAIARENMRTGEQGPARGNNWQTKRIKLVATVGWVLDEPQYVDWAMKAYRAYVEANLFPDGSSRDFKERDALSYHCSGLRSLVELALRARQFDVDLFAFEAQNGASVRKSMDFMVPYAKGEKVHAEWLNTKVELDRQRAKAGLPEYQPGKPWDPIQATELFEMMSIVDPSYGEIARKLSKSQSQFANWEAVLVEVLRDRPARLPAATTQPTTNPQRVIDPRRAPNEAG